ncbi:SDR family NAD(P)-dependent oxidoreductase [Microlunatus ginsengisoli]|uniref:SDR family NAD(P)-dependent oxidoreductase n=1 Tax=Microlunatus ginsengisoli TaxID=363863 RepID=A0ABP6ZLB2_9ACTN
MSAESSWSDGSARVALVTGAAHGIGRATARRLAADGAAVAVADLDRAAADRVVAEIDGDGGRAIGLSCDVGDTGSVDAAVAATVDIFGALDTLVCVAGGARPVPAFTETADADWSALLDLNLTSVVRCCRAALPVLARSERAAGVVVVGSVNGLLPFGDETYSAAKAALVSLVTNLAADWGPRGVRVNLVAPGTVRTRVWDSQPGGADRLRGLYPLGRVGEPEDVASAIAFLASADASWITGVALPVDGGLSVGAFRRLLADLPPQ